MRSAQGHAGKHKACAGSVALLRYLQQQRPGLCWRLRALPLFCCAQLAAVFSTKRVPHPSHPCAEKPCVHVAAPSICSCELPANFAAAPASLLVHVFAM